MWTIFFVQLVGLVSPGPDFFYISRKAAVSTSRSAFYATLGITIGVAFWAFLVLFGLAFLNRHIPAFQQILMIIGGSYLSYNGLKMVKITENAKLAQGSLEAEKSAWQELLGGLMINLSNPKIIVFFSSVITCYVSNLTRWQDSLLVLAILVGSSFVYFSLVALFFSRQPIRRFYAKYNRYLDNFAGAVFILFGVKLVYEGVLAFY